MRMGDTPDFRTMEKGMSVIAKESERLTGIVEELLDFHVFKVGVWLLIWSVSIYLQSLTRQFICLGNEH